MGQQQLLLLVLTTVITGLAILGGIEAFNEGAAQANQDALSQLAVDIGTDIQATVQKPAQLGGKGMSDIGGTTSSSSTITLAEMGYSLLPASESEHFSTDAVDGQAYSNIDGECALTQADVETSPIEITCRSDRSEVVLEVEGTGTDGIGVVSLVTRDGSGSGDGSGGDGDDGNGDDGGDGDDGDDGGGGGFGGGAY